MSVRIIGFRGNVTPKVLSIVFAVILWFHITTNQTFSSKYTIPIQYIGPSEGFMIASECPPNATVIVSGMGKDLAAFHLVGLFKPGQYNAYANITGLPEGESTFELTKDMINLGLFSDLKIENILVPDNGSITLNIDRRVKRTVAVALDSLPRYSIPSGFSLLGRPVAKPAFVMVDGPGREVEALEAISVAKFEKADVSEKSPVLTAVLEVPPHFTIEPQNVELVFSLEQTVTKKISGVAVSLDGFPWRKRPAIAPDSLDVTVKGAESLVAELESGDIRAAIDYRSYLDTVERGDSLMTPTFSLPDTFSTIEVVGVSPRSVLFKP